MSKFSLNELSLKILDLLTKEGWHFVLDDDINVGVFMVNDDGRYAERSVVEEVYDDKSGSQKIPYPANMDEAVLFIAKVIIRDYPSSDMEKIVYPCHDDPNQQRFSW